MPLKQATPTLNELIKDYELKRARAQIAYSRKRECKSKYDEYIQSLTELHKAAVALSDLVVKTAREVRD